MQARVGGPGWSMQVDTDPLAQAQRFVLRHLDGREVLLVVPDRDLQNDLTAVQQDILLWVEHTTRTTPLVQWASWMLDAKVVVAPHAPVLIGPGKTRRIDFD